MGIFGWRKGASRAATDVAVTDPLPVQVVSSGGTAANPLEDAAHVSGDPGVQTLGVRTDVRATLASHTGDYTPLQMTANGDARTRDDDLNTAVGTATTAAVDGDAQGGVVAHLRGINKKLAAGVTVTEAAGLATAHNGGSAVSVSNADTTLADANTARKSLTITNLSTTRALTVQCDDTAVAGAGVVLAAAMDANHPGGSVTILGSEYTGEVSGIMNGADATAGNVAVLEI